MTRTAATFAGAFPGLCNSTGAVGFFYLDTTKLTNAVHTISWVVYDNQNRGDGIGSRYFTVQNSGVGGADEMEEPREEIESTDIRLQKGYDFKRAGGTLTSGADGTFSVEMEALDRIELQIGARAGYPVVGGERRPLPIGSTLKRGVFYWQLGPGFLGEHELVFQRPTGRQVHIRVRVAL